MFTTLLSPENFTQSHLYRNRIDASSEAKRVTPAAFSGQNTYQVSGNPEWAIQTFQNTTTPPVIALIHLPDHRAIRTLQDNQKLKGKYETLHLK